MEFKGHVDFRACGQAAFRKAAQGQLVVECKRRPEIGYFDPMSITFESCSEWKKTDSGYLLDGMRVMILGMDGYLGWPLALKLAKLGCKVYGIDNMLRRKLVEERGAQSVTPIQSMEDRIKAANEHLDVNIDFREIDLMDRESLFAYIKEVQPESIVQFAEIPSAPYSMASVEKAVNTIQNNVVGDAGPVVRRSRSRSGCIHHQTWNDGRIWQSADRSSAVRRTFPGRRSAAISGAGMEPWR